MTIKDLARESGYSIGTVSRVLNNQRNVSQKAREQILRIANARGFQLNSNAKNLKQARGNSILAIVKGKSNELFAAMIETLQAQLIETEHPLLVDYIDEDENEVLQAVHLCPEKKPCGLLFLGGTNQNFLDDFGKITIPAVVVSNDASQLPFENLSSVTTDDAQAAQCAISYLIEQGHRHIAVLGGDRSLSDTSRLRYQGCMQAFEAHGLPFDEARAYAMGRYSYRAGYTSMLRILDTMPEVTAVFAMADVMAIGAIRALRDRALRVPEDISVIGFDGLGIGDYYVPKLSTITQSAARMARRSVELLLDCIENGAPAQHESVPFTLDCKQSVQPAKVKSEKEAFTESE